MFKIQNFNSSGDFSEKRLMLAVSPGAFNITTKLDITCQSGYFLGSSDDAIAIFVHCKDIFLFCLLLYVPSKQLWSLRDGQFT